MGAASKHALLGALKPGTVWRKHNNYNYRRMLAFINEIPLSHTFIEAIRASPWYNALGRLRGTQIGRDAFVDSLAVNDYDLPSIGDRAVVARNATIFCHLGKPRSPRSPSGASAERQAPAAGLRGTGPQARVVPQLISLLSGMVVGGGMPAYVHKC